MCIIFIYITPNPAKGKYRLIIATNRDEYFERHAKPIHKWTEDENVIGGKDLKSNFEGGTWFGVSLKRSDFFTLRTGALLNVTGELHQDKATGRGCVVSDFLLGNSTVQEYAEFLKEDPRIFNGFSFVGVELGPNPKDISIVHHTNVSKDTLIYRKEGTYAFGNTLPNEPLTKVKFGCKRFKHIIGELNEVYQQTELIHQLIELLKWQHPHLPDEVLARKDPRLVQHLSSVFVNIPEIGYGTRTHSILLVDFEGRVEFVENTMECPPREITQPIWSERRLNARL